MTRTRKSEILEKLESIEKRVEEKEDARRDFLKLVGEIKRGGGADDEVLRRIAEVRDKIFGKRVVLEYDKGVPVFVLFFILSNAFLFALAFMEGPLVLKAVALILAEFCVFYFTFLTGRVIGAKFSRIRVEGFYKYTPLEFGMKLDYVSYLKVPQKSRVIFFLTPILFENLVMAAQAATLILLRNEFYWIPLLILALNLPFSYLIYKIKRTGELYRLMREVRILLSEKTSI